MRKCLRCIDKGDQKGGYNTGHRVGSLFGNSSWKVIKWSPWLVITIVARITCLSSWSFCLCVCAFRIFWNKNMSLYTLERLYYFHLGIIPSVAQVSMWYRRSHPSLLHAADMFRELSYLSGPEKSYLGVHWVLIKFSSVAISVMQRGEESQGDCSDYGKELEFRAQTVTSGSSVQLSIPFLQLSSYVT